MGIEQGPRASDPERRIRPDVTEWYEHMLIPPDDREVSDEEKHEALEAVVRAMESLELAEAEGLINNVRVEFEITQREGLREIEFNYSSPTEEGEA